MRRIYPHVEIHEDFVIKKFIRKNVDFDAEYEKAKMFFDACEQSGIIAPKVLDADFKQKSISYSRIKNFQTVEDHYIKALTGKADLETTLALQVLAGKGLAAIHRNMKLQTTSHWSASDVVDGALSKLANCTADSFLSATPQAIQHGDFGFANLGYRYETDSKMPKLILFDPSANNYITQMPNEYCSIYVDLGVYFSDINGRVPVKYYPFMNWSYLPLIKASFVEGYQAESGIEVDEFKSEAMGYCSAAACYNKFYGNGIRKNLRMNFLYNRLKKNVFWK